MNNLSNRAEPNKAGPYLTEFCRRRNRDPNAALLDLDRLQRNDAIRLRLGGDNRKTIGQRIAGATGLTVCELAKALLPEQAEGIVEIMDAVNEEREAQG